MNNTLKQTCQGKSLKKYGNIGQKHTNMENFDVLILANQKHLE